jgi:hypothetical protein
LPSASVFLLLLCNDREVLGPWTNPRWLNMVASIIVGVMVVLSATLTITTVLPTVQPATAAAALGGLLSLVLLVLLVATRQPKVVRSRRRTRTRWETQTWTMPPLETLKPPTGSPGRAIGLTVLRIYLTITAVIVVLRVAHVAIGH